VELAAAYDMKSVENFTCV